MLPNETTVDLSLLNISVWSSNGASASHSNVTRVPDSLNRGLTGYALLPMLCDLHPRSVRCRAAPRPACPP